MSDFTLTSTAFEEGRSIPSAYTCDGDRALNPPLLISGAPEGTKTFALIMEDRDVPKEVRATGQYVHWVLFNIPAGTTKIGEKEKIGTTGGNDSGDITYAGPCPPPEFEPKEHRYMFDLYALDTELALQEGSRKEEVAKAMEGHILAEARLMGRYEKS